MLWKGFQRPKRVEVDHDTLTPTYGKFLAQPFERGFGTTVGNALRRCLLSSIEGAAVTAVHIEGVLHEFSALSGVMEDVTDVKRAEFANRLLARTGELLSHSVDYRATIERIPQLLVPDFADSCTVELQQPSADASDEPPAEPARLLEQGDVTGVEQVEAAVREDHARAALAKLRALALQDREVGGHRSIVRQGTRRRGDRARAGRREASPRGRPTRA